MEEDDQGLFGAPLILGDLLYFSPTDFKVATAGAGGVDNLDGTLQILIDAKDGYDIDSVELEEFGDYYLNDNVGNGTIGTNVEVIAFAFVTILEVDGTGIIPITENGVAVYSPVGGKYDLPTYGGLNPNEMEWEAEVKFDIDQILADAGYGPTEKATLVQFSLDNKLYARSEDGTQAEIAKKGAYAVTLTVPEPATLALLGLGCLLLRKRRV
ncbi:MAG: PEP-CTERM sorting domain-containing protein [Planctomycetota bacterium]